MTQVAFCIIAALAVYLFAVYTLEHKKVLHLDSDNARLRRLLELEKKDRESEEWLDIKSEYIVTDSDLLRWKNAKELFYEVRKRIANNIGWDIVKHFQPEESLTDTGKTKYSYKFKIRK